MQEIKEDLKSIKASQARTEVDIALIKLDVQHHIKRTDHLQNLVTVLLLAIIGGAIKLLFN